MWGGNGGFIYWDKCVDGYGWQSHLPHFSVLQMIFKYAGAGYASTPLKTAIGTRLTNERSSFKVAPIAIIQLDHSGGNLELGGKEYLDIEW